MKAFWLLWGQVDWSPVERLIYSIWNSLGKRPLTKTAVTLKLEIRERPNWSQFEALEEENNLPHQGESLINLEHFQNEH